MTTENKWDLKYSEEGFAYGTQPNDFLRQNLHQLPVGGRVLCLAEGEGRNSVFLAKQGFEVVAVDSSAVGLQKAQELARSEKVQITTIVADLAEFTVEEASYDAVISIFCHLPSPVRQFAYAQVVKGLKKDGVLLLEGYTPAQLKNNTGGPPSKELLLTLEILKNDFASLNILHAIELERDIIEGRLHTGPGAVVQLIATK